MPIRKDAHLLYVQYQHVHKFGHYIQYVLNRREHFSFLLSPLQNQGSLQILEIRIKVSHKSSSFLRLKHPIVPLHPLIDQKPFHNRLQDCLSVHLQVYHPLLNDDKVFQEITMEKHTAYLLIPIYKELAQKDTLHRGELYCVHK